MRRSLFILSIALCLTMGSTVRAETKPNTRLLYERGADAQSCPNEAHMRQGVAARLGREPFDPKATRLLAIRLKATKPGFAVTISVHDSDGKIVGKRDLSTKKDDCGELASAMQLAIAIAIDPLYNMPGPATPTLVVEPNPRSAESPSAGPPMPSEQIQAPTPPSPAPVQGPSRNQVGVGLSLAATSEPNPTTGLTIHYRRRTGTISWGAEGRADSTKDSSAKSGQIETSLMTASALLCWKQGALEVCALASVGNLRGRGVGFELMRSFSNPYAAAGLRLAHAFPLQGNFGLEFGADLLARLNTTTLYIDNDEVWKSSPLELALGARAVWTLP